MNMILKSTAGPDGICQATTITTLNCFQRGTLDTTGPKFGTSSIAKSALMAITTMLTIGKLITTKQVSC